MTNATSVPNYSTQGKLYEERKKKKETQARRQRANGHQAAFTGAFIRLTGSLL
jgi:hypothetical protein